VIDLGSFAETLVTEENAMWHTVCKMFKREEGQGLTEYALIIALVAVVVTVALTALQGGISGTLNGIVGSL
jgi:Flp pilus assembly pilin Flp